MPNMGGMSQVSKPILGLLLSAVVLFAAVMVVFRSSSSPGSSPNSGVYQSAISRAHQAVSTSNAANARLGAPVSTTPAPAPRHTSVARPAKSAQLSGHATVTASTKPASTASAQTQAAEVEAAITEHKVVGLLFYNPAATDDVATKAELAAAATKPGVLKLAVPVSEISSFKAITDTVPVSSSPTLIVIDRGGSASTITGFADRFEIAQRLNDALSAK
jgi:hypothetical protein